MKRDDAARRENSGENAMAVGRAARALAVLEVVLAFVVALAAVAVVARSPLARWQAEHLGRPFAEYLALGLAALAVMALRRDSWSSWGISGRRLSRQLDDGMRCAAAFALGKALTYPLGPRQAMHSLAEPVLVVGVVAACAWLLRPRGAPPMAAALVFVVAMGDVLPARAVSALVFYALFLGPAEEVLFRGYMHSRLNRAFGRPWRLAGAPWGAGALITAGLFTVLHVLNLPVLFAGAWQPLPATAVPTFAWGLALGYLRERTGSLLPPVLAHGVPQAIAWAVLGR